MRRYRWLLSLVPMVFVAACGRPVDVKKESDLLMQKDQEWSASFKDGDKFVSFLAEDGSISPPGMPIATGAEAVRAMHQGMSSTPGFNVQWTPTHAEVAASGDIGYTKGTYEASSDAGAEKGKYVTVWKRQADGGWKVSEDVFNADSEPQSAPSPHVALAPEKLQWGDAPPGLPAGAKVAVLSGDPSKTGPFTLRARFPAGYKIPAHWHPTDENVTVISGTMSLGMGDAFDEAKLQNYPVGSYAVLPTKMNHFAYAKNGAIVQIHGVGPFGITYVNPADDPRQAK